MSGNPTEGNLMGKARDKSKPKDTPRTFSHPGDSAVASFLKYEGGRMVVPAVPVPDTLGTADGLKASTAAPAEYTGDVDVVLPAEREAIARRRSFAYAGAVGPAEVKDDLVGLSLSGGGIRSAT